MINLNPFVIFFVEILALYRYVMIAYIIISLLLHFQVLNTRNDLVYRINYFLGRITSPVLDPIRKRLPDLGGIDISPIIVFFGLELLQNIAMTYFYVR